MLQQCIHRTISTTPCAQTILSRQATLPCLPNDIMQSPQQTPPAPSPPSQSSSSPPPLPPTPPAALSNAQTLILEKRSHIAQLQTALNTLSTQHATTATSAVQARQANNIAQARKLAQTAMRLARRVEHHRQWITRYEQQLAALEDAELHGMFDGGFAKEFGEGLSNVGETLQEARMVKEDTVDDVRKVCLREDEVSDEIREMEELELAELELSLQDK